MKHETQLNTGHGHVHPRPDGVKARCGGPALCAQCSREAAEQAILTKQAELAQPVALPFAILDDELAALRRFDECARDGEGYDVPKQMMVRLAEIGLLRRVSGSHYEHTNFGISVLNGDFGAHPPTLSALLEAVYESAWRTAASWEGIAFISDLGTEAYTRARDEAIRAAIEAYKKGQ